MKPAFEFFCAGGTGVAFIGAISTLIEYACIMAGVGPGDEKDINIILLHAMSFAALGSIGLYSLLRKEK